MYANVVTASQRMGCWIGGWTPVHPDYGGILTFTLPGPPSMIVLPARYPSTTPAAFSKVTRDLCVDVELKSRKERAILGCKAHLWAFFSNVNASLLVLKSSKLRYCDQIYLAMVI
jgi:hypothetical protein